MKVHLTHILSLWLVVFFILSCNDSKNTSEDSDTSVIEGDLNKQINVQNFFNTIPSSTEIFQIIQECKIHYNPDILNDPTKYKNYSLEKARALNLGAYGADLAISGAFNQAQESMLFLKCANYLAKELGISSAFDENIMNRLDVNKENRDSTLEIISQAFKTADKIFTENKRGDLSVYMLIGAFIESMYVAGEYAVKNLNDSVTFNKITVLYKNQRESLQYLINLLKNVSEKDETNFLLILSEINNHIGQSDKNAEEFQKTHELISGLRKQIISVY